ncbi:hypothetical protein [Persicobacter psychrovividus]|uniref:Cytochrome C Planctomycete-type domain-containing protein n=1 Tax=Persicobacter psychrovividus TaxID=387638 RepID=A0ABM7VKK5_9BACT|nr:hypothetical protein PEPS_37910 [Persicobacter psychrovividus]
MKYSLIFIFSTALIFAACLSEKEETLPEKDCPEAITFSGGVDQIINTNCAVPGCHVPGAVPPSLKGYDEVNSHTSNIEKRINGEGAIMPPSGKLPQATIDSISCWIQNGKLR